MQTILKKIEGKVPFYTPEWTFEDNRDFGVALANIFAFMAETAIKRLNDAPQKHFLSFLETLNISRIPARPARVPLTFTLSEGKTSENVLIPKFTQAAGAGPDGKPVIFETEKNLTAAPSKLKSVFSVIKEIGETEIIKDKIFVHQISEDGSCLTILFTGDNKQKHELYIGDTELFNGKMEEIILDIEGENLEILDDNSVVWEYSAEITEKIDGKEVTRIEWHSFSFSFDQQQKQLKLTRLKSGTALGGTANTITLADDTSPYDGMQIMITGGTGIGQLRKTKKYLKKTENDKEVKVYPVWIIPPDHTSDYSTTSIDEVELNGLKSRWIRCRVLDSKITDVEEIKITSLKIKSSPEKSTDLEPDLAFLNDTPIDLTKVFYPFGDKPLLYSTFYVANENAFSKKGKEVSLIIDLIPGIPSLQDEATKNPNTPMLSWEYWDGEGWTPLEGITENLAGLHCGKVKSETDNANKIILADDASADNDAYKGMQIIITGGKGEGQVRTITGYIGSDKTATIDFDWAINPDTTSTYSISACYVHSGTVNDVTGNTENTIILANNASANDDAYKGMQIIITGGTGEGQVRTITGYIGSDKKAEVDSNWTTPIDNTSIYLITTCCRKVTINEMPEVKPTKINGKENYWIRVRLIGGDYGKEYKIVSNKIESDKFCPPRIRKLTINYFPPDTEKAEKPEYIFNENNLTVQRSHLGRLPIKDDQNTGETSLPEVLQPFQTLPDVNPAVYFGFDKPLKGSNFSLFISLDERFEYPEYFRPRVKWKSRRKDGQWIELANILDETGGFIRSGMVQFVISEEMTGEKLFGTTTNLYWIRAEIGMEDFFTIQKKPGGHSEILLDNTSVSYKTKKCPEIFNLVNFSLFTEEAKKRPPKIQGFYFNSVWAVQSSTVTDEIIGPSTGETQQKFYLMNLPVMDEEIFVNEFDWLTEGEIRQIKESHEPQDYKEKPDDKGNMTQFWIKWERVSDFLNSGNKDRHYMIDRTYGEVRFGNGKHGKVPPTGQNICVRYRTGGGKSGNLGAGEISKIKTSVAFVDKVTNPIASDGGTDTEDMDALITRAPVVLKHRDRAVALEDFEQLTKEASRKVARVKVLPNFNAEGTFQSGFVTVIIVPESQEKKPIPSPELRNRVFTYLKERCSNVLSLKVIQPSYVEVSISAVLVTNAIDAIPVIERSAKIIITEFLHPLTGGKNKKGWDFGTVPCISDIYSIFDSIENVDHIIEVEILVKSETNDIRITESSGVTRLPGYALLFSGEHNITGKLDRRDGFATSKTRS